MLRDSQWPYKGRRRTSANGTLNLSVFRANLIIRRRSQGRNVLEFTRVFKKKDTSRTYYADLNTVRDHELFQFNHVNNFYDPSGALSRGEYTEISVELQAGARDNGGTTIRYLTSKRSGGVPARAQLDGRFCRRDRERSVGTGSGRASVAAHGHALGISIDP
ncbi:hypothetical protein EVAR_46626_1 [Eumeta japonica]|uniref:Uncharacterized protein n=1 Tax=Eumeta variegata TaxID=151549 RepID=A0A4C1WIP2_EUMVA|nr:hypothetical protein EVAR_46626_1 [Eumeta japonica]